MNTHSIELKIADDGSWSMHIPGMWAVLLSGTGEPTQADYDRAFAIWQAPQ